MIKLILFALCLMLGSLTPVSASFENANRLYTEGNFKEAVEEYEQLLGNNPGTNVYYNLGNAYYRTNQLGKAALNWIRTLTLDPVHPEARENLALLRANTGAKSYSPTGFIGSTAGFPGNLIAKAAIVAFWSACLFAAVAFFTRKGWIFYTGLSFGMLALVAGVLAYMTAVARPLQSLAVVLTESSARYAPFADSNLVAELPPGTEVVLQERSGDYILCLLPEGQRGFIPSVALERLVPNK